MEFRILGPLEVADRGVSLELGGARQRAVLALLLTRPNEVVSTDRLIDELWGREPPRTALNTVQYYVSQLRKLLGARRIVTRPPGYAIQVERGELDLERFERLLERGDAEALHEALALWRGPALADFAYESFAADEIARLEGLRILALEKRIDADLELGRHAELVGELERLVAQHPLRERLRGQLMLTLYRSGRQAEALAVDASRPVVVPFGGFEHDCSAVEIAGWLARSLGATLRLAGTEDVGERRDASRLLARASLVVQAALGILAEPTLVPAGAEGVVEAADAASLLVLGLSERWAGGRPQRAGPDA